jgi:hypothetical protein
MENFDKSYSKLKADYCSLGSKQEHEKIATQRETQIKALEADVNRYAAANKD